MSAARVWLVSARWDLALLFVPAWVACTLAFLAPAGAEVSPWAYLVLVLLIDVAHVYASLYRTYLRPGEVQRRPWLYLGTPVAVFVGAAAVHWLSWEAFWSAMAYLAVFHFIRQQVGFLALYRAVEGGSWRDPGAALERVAVYALTVGPVVWWHANLPRAFTWFMPGDFVAGLPRWVGDAALAGMSAVVAAHGVQRLRSGVWAPGRDLWVATTGLAWVGGIVLRNGDLAFTLTNVVLHGVAYLALVHETGRRRWAAEGRGSVTGWWFSPWAVPLFLAPLVLLALGEEALWDAAAWHEHAWLFGTTDAEAWAMLLVPLLTVPQVTHYVLDGFIWRMRDGENPGLRELWR